MVIVRPILSVVLSMILVIGGIPAIAFADSTDDLANTTGSELSFDSGNNVDSGQPAEERPGSSEKNTSDSIDESTQDSGFTVQDKETDEVVVNSNEVDPDSENSWRYSDGDVVSSQEGASTNYISLNDAVSTRSMVTNPNGYKVFNWFDQFSNGYYTGTNAYKGIDVSYHNGTIDWAKVKASGVDYVIIRCGYGMDQRDQDDTQWLNNVRGCLNNNIPFGVYIYSYATTTSRASSEADHVLRLLSEAGLDPSDLGYPIYFDMEDASTIDSDHAAIVKTFCNKIEAAGYEVGIYANKSWFNDRLTDSCFNNWTKWVAEWNASSGLTYSGLSNFTSGNGMWQFSDYGSVPGVGGACDLNYTFMEPVNDVLDIEGIYTNAKCQIVSAADNNLVLAAASGESGANVAVSTAKDDDDAQYWYIRSAGNGLVTFVSAANSDCVLDAAGSGVTDGANVSLWVAHGGMNQKWRITPLGDGVYEIQTASSSNLVLDAAKNPPSNGSNVGVFESHGGDNQRWLVKYDLSESTVSATGMQRNVSGSALAADVSVSLLGATLEEGKDYTVLYDGSESAPTNAGSYKVSVKGIGGFTGTKEVGTMVVHDALDVDSSIPQRVTNAKSTNLVLDAAKNPPASGANVAVYVSHGGANQAWYFELQNDGYYIIRNAANTDLILDAANSYPTSGSNVSAWEDNGGGLNQRWVIEQDQSGYLRIINAANNALVLDAAKSTPVEGSNVSAYEDNGGGLNQRWSLVATNDLSESTVSATGMQKA